MTPKLVTFDCAQTLVAVPPNWTVGGFAADCVRRMGLDATDDHAKIYNRLYLERLPEFCRVNQSRDPELAKEYWRKLASDWIEQSGLPRNRLDEMLATADELGFGTPSIVFSLYDDVIPCLDKLDEMGIRAAVISNWDHSLHRVLKMFGIYDRFATVVASLEEGVEKPDPRLFEVTLNAAGYTAEETLHVGDLPEDDYDGARACGIRAALIDRTQPRTTKPTLRSLLDLTEAFDWTD